MNMTIDAKQALEKAETQPDLKAVEFELALGAEDIGANSFEACVNRAAKEVGFVPLFNLPIPVRHSIQRLAALAAIVDEKPVFIFVGLHEDGARAIVKPDLSQMPHLEEFAEAFFDLLLD